MRGGLRPRFRAKGQIDCPHSPIAAPPPNGRTLSQVQILDHIAHGAQKNALQGEIAARPIFPHLYPARHMGGIAA